MTKSLVKHFESSVLADFLRKAFDTQFLKKYSHKNEALCSLYHAKIKLSLK